MKNQKILLVIVVIGLWSSSAVVAEPVKMGYFLIPPHQYLNENKDTPPPHGAFITFFEAAAAIMGEEIEWIGPLPLLRLANELKRGRLDGAVGFNRSSKSEVYLYYTALPVFMAQPILIVRHDNPLVEIRSFDNIKGYRIGLIVTSGGLYTPLIDSHQGELTLDKVGGDEWAKQNIKKLLAGRLDAVFDRQPYTLPFVAAQMDQFTKIKVLPIPDPRTPMYVVFSKASQRGDELLKKYNASSSRLKINYEDLAQQELDAAITSK